MQGVLIYPQTPHIHSLSHDQHPSEPTVMHHCHPKFMVHIRFTLGVVHSMGFDKCVMTCILHCTIIQSRFIALKFLCTLPIHLSLPPNHCLHNFAFSGMSYSPECPVVGIIQYVIFSD